MIVQWFTYSPFEQHDFLARVLGRSPEMTPAMLKGYQRVDHPAYPHVLAQEDGQVAGWVLELQIGDDWMLDREFGLDQGYYRRLQLPVLVGEEELQAWVMVGGPSLPWSESGQEDEALT